MDIIEVGQHSERFLIDYMANGSSVAKLMFDIALLKLAEKRNAAQHTINLMKADRDAHAAEVVEAVTAYTLKEVR